MSGSNGAVAAGHPETARAARSMLEDGGTAFDAVLAAFCTACVVEPVLASLGGGGFLLAQPAGGAPVLYDFFPQTPARQTADGDLDFFRIQADFGPAQQAFHIGRGAIAVPGAVAGLFDIHADLCTRPMTDIVAPAVELARRGVTVEPYQSYLIGVVTPIVTYTAQAQALYESRLSPGKLMQPGETMTNGALADLFDALAHDGADLFYRGDVADRIVAFCRDGGLIGQADLDAYRAARRAPLVQTIGGATIATNPLPSFGGILIQFALALWQRSAGDAVPDGGELSDLVAIMAATNKARTDSDLGKDPSDIGPLRLLDPNLIADYAASLPGRAEAVRGTTQISVIDGAGNAASMTVSNGEGCGHLIPGTGTMLNNILGEEDIQPRGFHRWVPDTRVGSMMAPTLLRAGDGRLVAIGSGGSSRIRTAMFQVLRHLIAGRMDLDAAIDAPRVHLEDNLLSVEPGFAEAQLEPLLAAYPNHKLWDAPNMFFGGVHAAARDPATGGFNAAGDHRRAGAVAYPNG